MTTMVNLNDKKCLAIVMNGVNDVNDLRARRDALIDIALFALSDPDPQPTIGDSLYFVLDMVRSLIEDVDTMLLEGGEK